MLIFVPTLVIFYLFVDISNVFFFPKKLAQWQHFMFSAHIILVLSGMFYQDCKFNYSV